MESIYREHRSAIWGVCYRMTGCAADADDLVQATFVRAIERPPSDRSRPWRPWLVKVAMNLSRDLLRRRRRRGYVGPWLPSPVEVERAGLDGEALETGEAADRRYGLLESVTFAFLLALEVLTPQQRAVLLLRDVFGASGQEAAEALGISDDRVRATLVRARRAMAAYDGARCLPDEATRRRTREALERFMACLALGDVEGAGALLAEDVRALHDGGGEFLSALKPLHGRRRVLGLYVGLAEKLQRQATSTRLEIRPLNGLPALHMEAEGMPPRQAGRVVVIGVVDEDGRLRGLHAVLSTRKLSAAG